MRCGLAILMLCVLAAPAWAAGSDAAVFAALDTVEQGASALRMISDSRDPCSVRVIAMWRAPADHPEGCLRHQLAQLLLGCSAVAVDHDDWAVRHPSLGPTKSGSSRSSVGPPPTRRKERTWYHE